MSYSSDVIPADRQSIFSDTYDGVVSPLVPHVHPYPTRFHGPIYNYPRFDRPYRAQSFMVPGNYLNPNLAGFGADQTIELPPVVITGELNPWYKNPLYIGLIAVAALGAAAYFVSATSKAPRRAVANKKRRAKRNAPYAIYRSEETRRLHKHEPFDRIEDAVRHAEREAKSDDAKYIVYDEGKSGYGKKGRVVAMFQPNPKRQPR